MGSQDPGDWVDVDLRGREVLRVLGFSSGEPDGG